MNIAWFQPGPLELTIVLVVILLLFGGKKLPGLSRALGRSLSEFKRGKKEGEKTIAELKKDTEDVEKPSEDEGDDKPAEKSEA